MRKYSAVSHGVSLIFLVFCIGFPGCSDDQVSKDVGLIKSRLEKIENRLTNIEKSAKKVSLLEVELRKLKESTKAWERAITARLKSRDVKENRKSRDRAAVPGKIKKGKSKSYTVRKGDSLYRIAREHGMTVAELCKLNKITSKTVLRVGAKLLVFSGDKT